MQQHPNTQGLVPLSDARDFKVADGNQDVRGWDVRAQNGEKIGEVKDLLVDTDALRARYLDVELDGGMFGSSRRVLVPVGIATLDESDEAVRVSLSRDGLADYPAYDGSSLTRDYETSLRDRIGSAGLAGTGATAGTERPNFYDDEVYDDRSFVGSRRRDVGDEREARVTRSEEELEVGTRRVEAGQAYIRNTVETERVRQEVPVTREEVVVERRPLSADSPTDATITEDEIRVPLMAEEVVTTKRVVPKEEVVIRKQAVSDTEVVEDEVRRERIDVDDATLRGDASSGARGGKKGIGERIADAVDNVKDRVDGNPRSRPGPDASDSRF